MEATSKPCPMCGKPVKAGINFCGQCGYSLSGSVPPTNAAKPVSSRPPRRAFAGTMVGMPAVSAKAGVGAPQSEAPASSVAAGHSEPAPSGPAPAEPGPSGKAPATSGKAGVPQRTVLGMPAVQAPSPTPNPTPSPTPEVAPSQPSGAPGVKSHRTMLGMPQATAPASAAQASRAAEVPGTANVAASAEPLVDSGPVAPAPRSSSSWILWTLLALLLFVILAVIGGAAWLMLATAPEVSVSVVTTATGDALRVEVPNASAEDRVRFGESERPVEVQSEGIGFVTFPLQSDDLHVGGNSLELVLTRDGQSESVVTELQVAYRVRADLTGLVEAEPSIAIVVHAESGSEVLVEGSPVALDDEGRGQVRVAVAPADTHDPFTKEFSYRVRASGADDVAEGVVEVSLSRATLELDRPGAELITEERQLDIAGAAHPDAVVTVDGETVELVSGRFSTRIPLATVGTYNPAVIAREPSKAPRVVTPQIRRVEDLAKEAEAYEVDRTLNYARLLQNPSTFLGRRVSMEGRVYNVSVERGQSVLQLLVRDCPPTERCPLWVTYPAATAATVNDWVRVIGVIGGEQRFRSENGDVLTVPRLDARFVLPVAGRSRR